MRAAVSVTGAACIQLSSYANRGRTAEDEDGNRNKPRQARMDRAYMFCWMRLRLVGCAGRHVALHQRRHD